MSTQSQEVSILSRFHSTLNFGSPKPHPNTMVCKWFAYESFTCVRMLSTKQPLHGGRLLRRALVDHMGHHMSCKGWTILAWKRWNWFGDLANSPYCTPIHGKCSPQVHILLICNLTHRTHLDERLSMGGGQTGRSLYGHKENKKNESH